ncbi:LysR family transcriptional regulator [Synechococcales cyanobacterium C]|uniref:LysR family transcriptional regulator n=1 Tax=Petrachloros mirabilis ULC683 TaxID=2781853 RepID=A0A8K1ZY63_9CYAN|nr:LysR family transcriptional regulator [Petrachloros mirabilis]NCJ06068.1 LysR family transcriptional regulator [Petrachloros mirabilis ULC683]
MKQVTFHQLKVFEVTARRGSFTRAAEELFLTQPTVSIQMKQLTKAVGLPLFEQVGKRLFLTDAGQELLATCQDIFERLDQFDMTIADLQGLKKGQLRLCVISTAKYVIPRLLGPFCRQYPGIEVSLSVTNHEQVLERLRENLDDLYIPSQAPEHLDVNCFAFMDNPLVVLASRQHPLAQKVNIPIAQLNGEDFIMRESGSGTRQAVEQLFERHNVAVNMRLELGSNEAIKQAVAGGLGISVLSRHCLALEGFSGQVITLDVEEFPIRRHWHVVYPKGKQLSVVAQTFFEYLQTQGKQVLAETANQDYLA